LELLDVCRGFVRQVENDADAQSLKDLEQLAPLSGFAAALDLPEEVFAYANAAGGIVLSQALGLAHSTDQGTEIGGIVKWNLHGNILAFARILAWVEAACKKILKIVRIIVAGAVATLKST
jgi:hypothetical protein